MIDWIVDLGRRSNHRMMVQADERRLLGCGNQARAGRGIGRLSSLYTEVHTDAVFLASAQKLLCAPDAVYSQFATHNAHTLSAVYQMARDAGNHDYEFQCLHGMGERLYDEVVGADQLGKPCRIYVPVGSHKTLLAYLVRRLLENGANSSFVSRLVDENVSIDDLAADPITRIEQEGIHPHPAIPLPRDLYGVQRKNSSGLDLSDEHALSLVASELAVLEAQQRRAAPMLANGNCDDVEVLYRKVPRLQPCQPRRSSRNGDRGEPERRGSGAVGCGGICAPVGSNGSRLRASLLERAADLLEARRALLISLAVREAGKSLPNAIAEVREAADFCRYYAQQMRDQIENRDQAEPLGPVVCISPGISRSPFL